MEKAWPIWKESFPVIQGEAPPYTASPKQVDNAIELIPNTYSYAQHTLLLFNTILQ